MCTVIKNKHLGVVAHCFSNMPDKNSSELSPKKKTLTTKTTLNCKLTHSSSIRLHTVYTISLLVIVPAIGQSIGYQNQPTRSLNTLHVPDSTSTQDLVSQNCLTLVLTHAICSHFELSAELTEKLTP